MHPIYHPALNRAARTLLHPFRRIVPPSLQFPVTGVIRVDLPEGRSIRLATNPTSYLTKVLFWRGFEGFEPGFARLFIALARQSTVLLDVGANIGYYSLLAAAFNPDLRVHSFEPLPDALVYLRENIRLNGFTRIAPADAALSNENGSTTFFVTRNPKFPDVEHHITGTSGLDREAAAGMNLVDTVEVRMETMDHYVEANVEGRVDLVKIDVEGSEYRVLAGARRVLTEHRPIILCEVLPGEGGDRLETIFRGYDYRLYRATADGLRPADHLRHDAASTKDHVMVPEESLQRIATFEAHP